MFLSRISNRATFSIRGVRVNLFAVLAVWLGLYTLHVWTYEWQMVTLSEHMRPQTRTTCELSAVYGRDKKAWPAPQPPPVYMATFADPTTTAAPPVSPPGAVKRPKIAILMMYDSEWDDDLMDDIMTNRNRYANRHGYVVVNGNDLMDKRKPAAWSKLPAAVHYLEQFDYVFYMDTDAVVMNMNVELESFIVLAPTANILLTTDAHGLNTGLMLLKASAWTRRFLTTVFDQDYMAKHDYDEHGHKYPFEYEQRAVHYMWGTSFWLERGLTESPDSADVRNNVAMFPQCAFNSYTIHPLTMLQRTAAWEAAQYADGDFVVHFAGVKGATKHNLMAVYLRRSSADSRNMERQPPISMIR